MGKSKDKCSIWAVDWLAIRYAVTRGSRREAYGNYIKKRTERST